MAWIESHQELGEHPKRKKLSRLLGISKPEAVGHLHCLWWWVLDYADDGDLSRFDAEEIAEAAGWELHATTFIDAMVLAGFIDRDGDRLTIHDHDDYVGRIIDKRRANAERARRFRERHAPETDRNALVTRESRVSSTATQPNRTEQNQTPPPPPYPPNENGAAAASDFVELLNGNFDTISADFNGVDPELDPGWLRRTLKQAASESGPLESERLVKGLEVAFLRIQRAVAVPSETHPIRNMRGFATNAVVTEIQEQAHA